MEKMASLFGAAVAKELKPQQTKPLLELCLTFLSKNLHIDIITYKLFLLPNAHLTAIKDQLSAIGMQCQFTDIIFKCALEKDYDSLPKWTWDEWCENTVAKSTNIVKCAVLTCDSKQVIELNSTKNFAITKEEADAVFKIIGTSKSLTSTSMTCEGKKYILSQRHPTIVYGKLLDADSLTEDGQNKENTIDSSCIIACIKISKEEHMLVVAISTSATSNNTLVLATISMQTLAEELTTCCRYLAEYFAYINGENPNEASNNFV